MKCNQIRKLKINLFGESCTFMKILLSETQQLEFKKVASKLNLPLCQALADPFFYHKLNNKEIQSLEDLKMIKTVGLINSKTNQIEIWFDKKKIQKLNIDALNEELLLFPLYNTTTLKAEKLELGIYIKQIGVGLVSVYETYTDNFSIDDMEFQLLETDNMTLLCELKYKGLPMISKKNDILINSQIGFEITDPYTFSNFEM